MVIVHVKHYLTAEGMEYFNQWFTDVKFYISKQDGFESIVCEKLPNDEGCYIILKFRDQKTLDAWVAVDVHEDLVNALDPYRSRDYWEVVKTEDENADSKNLEWEKIKLAT